MTTKNLLGIVFAVLLAGSLIADDVVLNPEHPDRYVVVKGDTLWDISTMFLQIALNRIHPNTASRYIANFVLGRKSRLENKNISGRKRKYPYYSR